MFGFEVILTQIWQVLGSDPKTITGLLPRPWSWPMESNLADVRKRPDLGLEWIKLAKKVKNCTKNGAPIL